jgi:hypothetical protein
VVCLRFVNYRIDEAGNYQNVEVIETKNVMAHFDYFVDKEKRVLLCRKTREYELLYHTEWDGRYKGLEDVRLLSNTGGDIYYHANRGVSISGEDIMRVEQGRIEMEDMSPSTLSVSGGSIFHRVGKTVGSQLLQTNPIEIPHKKIEKNWVLFYDKRGDKKVVYNWFPLTIGSTKETTFSVEKKVETPHFFKGFRGSTNGVSLSNDNNNKNEIWFIVHMVSYEDRRYYYHTFVVLDADTYEVKRYTRPFTFDGSPVEYTLGFVYLEELDQFLIGYSIMDRETHYRVVEKSVVEGWMV